MKTRIFTFFIGLTIALSFSSCGTSGMMSGKTLDRIELGQTKDEVRAIMKGSPDNKRFMETTEQWEYKRYVNLEYKIILIDFYQGRVVSFNMLDDRLLPPPPSITIGAGYSN